MFTNSSFISEKVLLYLEYLIEKYTIKQENTRPEYFQEQLPLKTLKEDLSFKTFLKKDNKNNYYIIDKKNTIKCFFKIRNIKKCIDKYAAFLLTKNFKNIIIDVKHSKIDIRLQKTEDKILFPTMVIIISEFSLSQSTLIPYTLLNYHHFDINLDADVDKNSRRFLSVMKKLNLSKINDKETDNKIWFYSKISNNELIELSNIKLNNQRQITFINCDLSLLNKKKESPTKKRKLNSNKKENKENINNENMNKIMELEENDDIQSEKENINEIEEEKVICDIIGNDDLVKLFFSMPSIKDNNIKDFGQYEEIDIELLGKKRTREKENNILNDSFEENLENTRRKTGPKRHSTFRISDYIG